MSEKQVMQNERVAPASAETGAAQPGPGGLTLEDVLGGIAAATGSLQEGRKQLKAQEASVPETLERTMQACELALSAVRAGLVMIRSQASCIEAMRAHIEDSGRLHNAVADRLAVLMKL